ncbi:hypothetical protein Q7P37_009326 [Cladosporium fusiforme]
MKSAIQSVILALALSVSAAPIKEYSSADKPSSSGVGKHSGSGAGSRNGPPLFFGDSDYKGPSHSDDNKESSPSATNPHVNSNSTATSASITTSTSTSAPLDKRFNNIPVHLPSRIVTPNFKNFVSSDGYTMFGMQNPVCSDVTLIFARGTTEKGNMGTCIGPELAEALRKEIPSLSVQGVDYPANSEGNTKYGASGGPYMAMLARSARAMCPKTKIVLAGYSQGARVIHGAIDKSENPFDGRDVAAVVAFGDPLNGREGFKHVHHKNVLQVCGNSDGRCQRGHVDMEINGGHISYGSSAKDVAKWIKKTVN